MRPAVRALVPVSVADSLRTVRNRVDALRLRGNVVHCPICSGTYRRLLPGMDGVPGVCPGCRSLGRHRKIALALQRRTELGTRPLSLLHVAPEHALRRWLSSVEQLRYVTGDLIRRDVSVRLDITDMQFPDRSFDVIVCSHVLEHIGDDAAAMQEMHRVLGADGLAIINVPADLGMAVTDEDPSVVDPAERLRRFGQSDHVRVYGADLPRRLTDAGFMFDPAPVYSDAEFAAMGLGQQPDYDVMYVCRRGGLTARP